MINVPIVKYVLLDMFPSPCFYKHFEVSHQKPVTETPHLEKITAFILFVRHKLFITYENYYIQWLLLLFLVIFSASLSESDDFVLFDSLDGNAALFTNILCNIPILHTS